MLNVISTCRDILCVDINVDKRCVDHSSNSNVQVSIFVTCLNFAGTGSRLWQLYVAFVMTWYLAFKLSGHTAKAVRPDISGKNLPQNAMKPLFCSQIVGKFQETFQRAYSLPPITTKNDEFDAKSWVPDLLEAPSRFTWPLIWIGPNYFSDVQSFSKLFYAFIY